MSRRVGQLGQVKKDAFLEHLRKGACVVEAAAAARIPSTSLYRHRDKDAEFAAQWAKAFEDGADKLEEEAQRRALSGSDTLLIFLLKSRRPERFAHFERHEITGPNRGPIHYQMSEKERDAVDSRITALVDDLAARREAKAAGGAASRGVGATSTA